MSESFRLSRLAALDLEHISDSVGRHNAQAAEKLIRGLFDRFELLAGHPQLGEDFGDGIRRMAFGSYVVYFQETVTELLIVRVVHGSRELTSLED